MHKSQIEVFEDAFFREIRISVNNERCGNLDKLADASLLAGSQGWTNSHSATARERDEAKRNRAPHRGVEVHELAHKQMFFRIDIYGERHENE